MTTSVPDKIYASELQLLRWCDKQSAKKLLTVKALAKHLRVSRQAAYVRYERALERGWLSYRFARGQGPRDRAIYSLTEAGHSVLAATWRKRTKTTLERA